MTCFLLVQTLLLVSVWFSFSLVHAAAGSGCPHKHTLTIPEAAVASHSNRNKLIIAHRGASFHMPEHTLAAYRLALEMGADFVEPDLVATSDGHLIALHTIDLNVTTDVVTKFGTQRAPQFSPFVNRTGYWTYQFTLDEIKTLRVRQRLPRARTTAFDGMFEVPTLREIQTLVSEWNTQRVPLLLFHPEPKHDNNTTATTKPHKHHPQSAGIYAELKSAPWLARDANISLVNVFFQHLQDYPDLFAPMLECPSKIPKFDEYKVPPLVVQSFERDVLEHLIKQWKQHPATIHAPLPPAILLVPKSKCWEESFWFQVGDQLRNTIQGVGLDKACLSPLKEEEAWSVVDRAKEFRLVVHPYTERPEHEFLLPGFDNADEETQYLLCDMGVSGVFTESVHTAITVARSGCPDKEEGKQGKIEESFHTGAGAKGSPTTAASKDSGNSTFDNVSQCMQMTASQANFYVGLATFGLGVVLSLFTYICVRYSIPLRRRRAATRAHQIPTEDDGVVLDDNDAEML